MDNIKRNYGLTDDEGKVMDALVEAWNQFSLLEVQHPMDNMDFCNAIHNCQYLLAIRIARREYPEGWLIRR